MIRGYAWPIVKVWHDEDDCTEYRVKVEYEYEYISHRDPYYQEMRSHIEVIEWPEGITDVTKDMINHRLGDVLAELLEPDDDYHDTWDNTEQQFENE